MTQDLIAQALGGAGDTRKIVIGSGVLERAGRIFAELFEGRTAVVVADDTTFAVAGHQVQESLTAAGVEQAEPYIFPARPTLYADYENVALLRGYLAGTDAIVVAIGSGTLNDLSKRACAELGREYLSVATAASQDGYAAYGASITQDGYKRTLACPAPAGVLADLSILAAAPPRMTATGYGDLIEKVTAGADWILADALGIEPIDQHVWHLVQGPLWDSLANPGGVVQGDPVALRRLTEGLLMSGLAMQAYQTSRPASGAGHHFSHLWEMEHLGMAQDPPLSHGLKVGLGTVAIAALYEVVLTRDLTLLDVDAAVGAWPSREHLEAGVRATFEDAVADPAVAQVLAKYVTAEQLRRRLERLRQIWPEVAPVLRDQVMPAAQIQQSLAQAGAVSHPAQVGLGMPRFRETYVRAQLIRDRFTILDLLVQAGLLAECVEVLFSPDGFWGSQSW